MEEGGDSRGKVAAAVEESEEFLRNVFRVSYRDSHELRSLFIRGRCVQVILLLSI